MLSPHSYTDEYLRRNLLHCKAVGALSNTRAALGRAMQVKRMPLWIIAALESIEVRIEPLTHEMAKHRNEVRITATSVHPK